MMIVNLNLFRLRWIFLFIIESQLNTCFSYLPVQIRHSTFRMVFLVNSSAHLCIYKYFILCVPRPFFCFTDDDKLHSLCFHFSNYIFLNVLFSPNFGTQLIYLCKASPKQQSRVNGQSNLLWLKTWISMNQEDKPKIPRKSSIRKSWRCLGSQRTGGKSVAT